MSVHTIDIEYDDPAFELRAPEDAVRSQLLAILDKTVDEDVEFSVSFVSDDAIRGLNKQWRNKDESTDILSFVQEEGDDQWPENFMLDDDDDSEDEIAGEPRVLGDIVISLDSMARNAQEFNVSEDEELKRLLVHGVLHLLGWDHATNDAEEPMLVEQERLIGLLWGGQH